MLNNRINEITDVNAIFQAVTMECAGELDEGIVNDLIESILNDTPSITTLFYHSIMQEMQILSIYSKFTHMEVRQLINKIAEDYESECSGYSMQIFFFKEVINVAANIVDDTQRLNHDENSEKFNSSAEIFFSTFNDFPQAFRFIPQFNDFFAKKILPEGVTVNQFLEQVFLAQQLYLTSGSME